MYEEFYGLKEKPFSKTPDPRFLYESKNHREALARLQYAVEERELMVLTGEIGSGKTTLSRALIDTLGEGYKAILIINPRLTPTQFLRTIAKGLDVKEPRFYRADLLDGIYHSLYRHYEGGICPVVIVDEAQLIPGRETFEEIRLLTNFQLDDKNLLSLILIGQPELRRRLSSRYYSALCQRVGIQYHLPPLTLDETREYINFRLRVAGRDRPIFTNGAIEGLYRFSQGIPRRINNLATCCLLEGFGKGVEEIDTEIIRHVAGELELNPLWT